MTSGRRYAVSDVMTRKVVALGAKASFKDIVRTLREWQVTALPVLDGDQRVVGVVSEADLLAKEETRDAGGERDPGTSAADRADPVQAGAVTADQLMSTPAITVTGDATLACAARAMACHRVKRLPVVDGAGRLTGIVSRSDLLKVFLRSDEEIAEDVRRNVVERLFVSPSEPLRIEVHDGVVTLTGRVRDSTLVPVMARLVRSVEGVVDVDCALMGPLTHPGIDPDRPGTAGTRLL
ncbi:CBS domain-containing protein [Streptomyces sp. MMS24-I2-30]|uniref:CBS domain-containing protein n=1 Tax=Streptomyces sp. MMS24-I2-30 TaxID=3351564 RepID=UPI0038968F2A